MLTGLMTMFQGDNKGLNKQLDLAVKTGRIDKNTQLIGQLAFIKEADLKKELFVGITDITDEKNTGHIRYI